MNYPDSPTTLAKINSQDYDSKLLGKNDLGSVYIHGPFGNLDSNIKIAYLIGMHPLESKSHRALFEELTSCENLNYCYYLYNIEVDNPESESEGRLEGQLLAQEFVKDEIINN
ncbi:MAG: adhesin, partial [Methanobrevibacter sp.]|nr:adhesin [Methanobrevibacter sp.]